MSLDLTDDESSLIEVLVQLMAWCRKAASNYLSQCWPRAMLPYGITRPQGVNLEYNFYVLNCFKEIYVYTHIYVFNFMTISIFEKLKLQMCIIKKDLHLSCIVSIIAVDDQVSCGTKELEGIVLI